MWKEEEWYCAEVMILVRKGDTLGDNAITNSLDIGQWCFSRPKRRPRTPGPSSVELPRPPWWPRRPKIWSSSAHIFEAGLRFKTEVYLQVMEETVLSWIKTVAGDTLLVLLVWQQDSTPTGCPTGHWPGLRRTNLTLFPRTAGLRAALTLTWWTILSAAILEHIPRDMPTGPGTPDCLHQGEMRQPALGHGGQVLVLLQRPDGGHNQGWGPFH